MTDLFFPTSAFVTKPRSLVERGARKGGCAFPIRYGVFLHPSEGPIVIDTGYTERLRTAGGAALAIYRALLSPILVADGQPTAVLASMGFAPGDVRHVVVTHLHADHVCGLGLFPNATFHMSGASLGWWEAQPGLSDVLQGFFRRLMPRIGLNKVRTFDPCAPKVLPCGNVGRDILGDGTVMAVNLPGHMDGHWGVAFPLRNEPVLYAADVTWTAQGYRDDPEPGFGARHIVEDVGAMRATARVVAEAERQGVRVVLAHDPAELAPFR